LEAVLLYIINECLHIHYDIGPRHDPEQIENKSRFTLIGHLNLKEYVISHMFFHTYSQY